jgi:hypothetical protein
VKESEFRQRLDRDFKKGDPVKDQLLQAFQSESAEERRGLVLGALLTLQSRARARERLS